MKKRTILTQVSRLLILVLVIGLLVPAIPVSAAQPALSRGQENIVKRARQLTDIRWTPLQDIYGWNKELTYRSGVTYTGLPYGQPVNTSYVPWKTSLEGFLAAVNDPNSLMYTSYSSYNKHAPYYSIDCSAFVSWAWDLSSRQTTSTLTKYATAISSTSYEDAQVGDCLNKSGSHVVLITDIGYDAAGKINAIEISEATTNASTNYCCQVTRYGAGGKYTLQRLVTKYFGDGYILYRCNTRDAVTYQHSCAIPLDGDVCADCGVGGYLAQCEAFPTAVELTVTETCYPYSLPSDGADLSEMLTQPLYRGTMLASDGLFLNTEGDYWYRITLEDGSTGYVFSGHTEMTGLIAPKVVGGAFPTAITGSTSLQGTVVSEGSKLVTVQASVSRQGSTNMLLKSTTVSVGGESYCLKGSTVDSSTVFSKLSTYGAGYYTLKISATCTAYYADGNALDSVTATADAALYDFHYGQSTKTHAALSFRANGGVCPRDKRVIAAGTAAGELPVPTRMGYTFDGWHTEAGQLVTSDTVISADTTLYAHWSPLTYVVDYDANGGTGAPGSQQKIYGEALTIHSEIPVREGYDFLGWATDPDAEICGYQPGDRYHDNAPLTLCALWLENALAVVATGFSGETQWTLTADGTLTFTGSGPMRNYEYKSEMPWYKHFDSITSVVIGEGVTSIGAYAFYGAPNLESVEIPSTVTAIGDYAFKNAARLTEIALPEGLTSLGESAFYACTALSSIEIPASLWTVKPYTFKNCTALEEVIFHEGNLMKISDGAFYGTGLEALSLPDCLDILDTYAFKGCANLAYIELGSGLTELREAVFYGTAISEIEIPEGITKIGPYVFKNCTDLEQIHLPDTLTAIGESAFYACDALESAELPDGVKTVGNYAFRRCESLADLTLGDSLEVIGECAFYGCAGLTELVIPDSVTTIKPYAFKTCTGLREVTLGSGIVTLGESAFNTCTDLTTMVFPASLKTIGNYCFSGSTRLWKLTFQGNAPAIGTGAFKGLDACAYYPLGNSTWTKSVRQNYGGTILWRAR